MAVNLAKKTSADQLTLIISVIDSAIDWDRSLLATSAQTIEEKKKYYSRVHDARTLVFKEGEIPTVFVFKHSKRVDVKKSVRLVASRMSGVGRSTEDVDLLEEVFQKCFEGTREGLDGKQNQAPRVNGTITQEYLQALADAEDDEGHAHDLFDELAAAYLATINPSDESTSQKK